MGRPPELALRRGGASHCAPFFAAVLLLIAGCNQGAGGNAPANTAYTSASHPPFLIATGVHAVDCNTCHGAFDSFTKVDCLSCHAHEKTATDRVHNPAAVPQYGAGGYASLQCWSCHKSDDGTRKTYSHKGITDNCAACHDVAGSFPALPVSGFTHFPVTVDCAQCHTTSDWTTATGAPSSSRDPAQDVTVTANIPSFSQTSIQAFSLTTEVLPMPMNHQATKYNAAANSACQNCHAGASTGTFFPGVFHQNLTRLGLAQPGGCLECHATSVPTGFVGPVAASRKPPSGEMAHDAVAWTATAPTQTSLVTQDCAVCHLTSGWGKGPGTAAAAPFHASLTAASLAQPASCLGCHANSRPSPSSVVLPGGLTFDHSIPAALVDCAACHAAGSTANQFSKWSGGRYHQAGSSPTTCLPCHEGERPTSTSGWQSSTWSQSPFDYGTNSAGVTHGAGQDCVACHTGPGTGVWGSSQNWQAGHFNHTPTSRAGTTCVACHQSQRPDLQGVAAATVAQVLMFDHSVDGTGDCFGCHQATVVAGSYVNYGTPTTRQNSGDWQGGKGYPGSTLVNSGKFITVTALSLVKSGGLITGTTQTSETLYDAMLHTSAALPPELNAGPASPPSTADSMKCWHCHQHTTGTTTVTSFSNGAYHKSLDNYMATPTAAVTGLPQPTTTCLDCHTQTTPIAIVEKSASDLQPMDHAATFAAPATIGGVTANGVKDLECSVCHQQPGNAWSDGAFHKNIGTATPADCTACHYPLMADSAAADVSAGVAQQGTQSTMKHLSTQLGVQSCQTCHTGALAQGSATPLAAHLWTGGKFHVSLTTQATACLDCHVGPAASTQSTVSYTLTQGQTASNARQWASHGASDVTGKDCAVCHQADAQKSGSNTWSKSTSFHAKVSSPVACQGCHGLTNGGGSTPGTNNNLPASAIDSSTATTAGATGTTTGVSASTRAQINHADVNAAGDCKRCHTQLGQATSGPAVGAEWAQASFHANFGAGNPLKLGPGAGRCSNCHINEKPTAVFNATWDHTSYTATSSTDCSSCHTYPGTGTSAAPNWLGAKGVPDFIVTGMFIIPQPPAATANLQQATIPNLPHPTVSGTLTCASCHSGGNAGKMAIGYDHLSTLIKTSCDSCHEAGSDLVGTVWNGAPTKATGAGDTRPITLTTATATYKGDTTTFTVSNHFYAPSAVVDCSFCHLVPAAPSLGLVTTGAAYTTAWTFKHPPEGTCTNSCKLCHTNNCPN